MVGRGGENMKKGILPADVPERAGGNAGILGRGTSQYTVLR
jgi:hypothetical protein